MDFLTSPSLSFSSVEVCLEWVVLEEDQLVDLPCAQNPVATLPPKPSREDALPSPALTAAWSVALCTSSSFICLLVQLNAYCAHML